MVLEASDFDKISSCCGGCQQWEGPNRCSRTWEYAQRMFPCCGMCQQWDAPKSSLEDGCVTFLYVCADGFLLEQTQAECASNGGTRGSQAVQDAVVVAVVACVVFVVVF